MWQRDFIQHDLSQLDLIRIDLVRHDSSQLDLIQIYLSRFKSSQCESNSDFRTQLFNLINNIAPRNFENIVANRVLNLPCIMTQLIPVGEL